MPRSTSRRCWRSPNASRTSGHAYRTDLGNLYYAVGSYPEYGRLSGNSLDALRAGHRGEVEGDKRDAADFALWKAAGEGRILKWPSARWGEGFPGWHLECSAMAMRHLGDHFDIHTGGEDNVFPHHEDEIAQSAPLVGGPPADLWVHGAHLLMAGRKMAKSAGNFQRITELADAGIAPLAFRYLCLTARYSRKLDYSDASLAAAATTFASLGSRLRALGPAPADGPWAAPPLLRAGRSADRPDGSASGVRGLALDDGSPEPALTDRAGPAGRAPLRGGARAARAVRRGDRRRPRPAGSHRRHPRDPACRPAGGRATLARPRRGRDPRPGPRPRLGAGAATRRRCRTQTRRLLAARARARAARDWAQADHIRDQLRDLGVEPVDRPDGTSDLRPIKRP